MTYDLILIILILSTSPGGKGLGESAGFTCPDGFINFIDKCVWIPTSLPPVVTYSEAVTSCRAAGRQILNVTSLAMFEGIRGYLRNISANASLWVGLAPGIGDIL
jgi:hypothetical protein